MKTINKILWQAALPLAFVACQNEDIITDNAGQGTEVYTLQGIMGDNGQSRAQVELNRTEVENERFIWNREDQITLYDIDAETITGNTFQIDKEYNDEPRYGNPSGEALFTTETPLTTGNQVTAVYPAQTTEPMDGTITLNLASDYTIENNLAETWKNYMRQNMFMYASAVKVNESTSLQFRHLCAMARITYTNATTGGVNLTQCELEGDGEYFATSAKLNIKEGTLSEKTNAKTAGIHFNDWYIAPGMAEEIYLLFFPGADLNKDEKLTLKIYTEGNETPSTVDIPLSEIKGNNANDTGFKAGKRYWFQVIQTPKGLIRKSSVAEGTISNAKLIRAIQDQLKDATLTTDENGFISVKENQSLLDQVTIIEECFNNLEGIEYLPNLETLRCWENWDHPLTKLDVSQNAKLKTLECSGSALTSLDVSNNPELTRLICHGNKLTSLDLSKNTKLQELNCSNNQLTALNVSTSSALTVLNCGNNQITSLTLGNHPELISLSCNGNKLTTLDVSKYTKLQELNCSNNKLAALNVSNNAALNRLSCYSNKLTSLNISQNTKLTFLDCQVNNLQSLDVTRLTELQILYCSNNEKLSTLDISHNMKLTALDYSYTSIPSLNVSKHTTLTYLACGGEKITSLDVSQNTALETLNCENSSLTSLDISKNVNLKELSCRHSHIKELDITNNSKIEYLLCGGQRDENGEITMTLTLTAAQNTLWENSWKNDTWANTNVTPIVKE